MTHRRRLLLASATLLIAVACSTPLTLPSATPSTSADEPPHPWAWEADIWIQALSDVIDEQGGRAWRYFLDPHVEWDSRSLDPDADILRGADAVMALAVLIPRDSDASVSQAVFLGRDGAVVLRRFDWAPANLNWTPLRAMPAHLVELLSPIEVNGATRMVTAMAAESWRERRETVAEPDAAEAIATTWLDVWSGTAPVDSLYSPDATLSDTIAGVTAAGSESIAALVRAESEIDWQLALVGGRTEGQASEVAAAIYPVSFEPGVLDSIVLVVVGDGSSGCPGSMAVVLDVEAGKVTRDQRYWELARARACLPTDRLPTGWWSGQALVFDDRYVPYEDLATPTGTVAAAGVEVEMINSTDALDALVKSALLRFDHAGIGVPDVRSIRFSEFDQSCHHINGRVEFDVESADLLMCFHEHDLLGIDRWLKTEDDCMHIILHELAHVWMRQHLDDANRQAFTDSVGLEAWVDGDRLPWQEQGREVAAETMAWGLFGHPMTMYKIGAPDDATLREGFELLTGRPPLQPAEN